MLAQFVSLWKLPSRREPLEHDSVMLAQNALPAPHKLSSPSELVSSALRVAWALTKNHFLLFAFCSLVISIGGEVLAKSALSSSWSYKLELAFEIGFHPVRVLLLFLLMPVYLYPSLTASTLAFPEMKPRGRAGFVISFFATLVFAKILVSLASFAFVLPGIYLAFAFLGSISVCGFQKNGPLRSLRISYDIARSPTDNSPRTWRLTNIKSLIASLSLLLTLVIVIGSPLSLLKNIAVFKLGHPLLAIQSHGFVQSFVSLLFGMLQSFQQIFCVTLVFLGLTQWASEFNLYGRQKYPT